MKTFFVFVFFVATSLSAMAQEVVNHLLIARNLGEKVMHDGLSLRTFGFAQTLNEQPPIPGPTLYANEGDSVVLDLFNVSQGAPHTIHLHGLDVNQENDGVPHLSFEVHHMDHGFYYFVAPHPGTYFYHCHVVSSIHVQAGMYGVFIVKPSDGSNTTWDGGYAYDQDRLFTMSEMDPIWHEDSVLEHPHDTTVEVHDISIPAYNPTYFLVNGKSEQQLLEPEIALQTSKEAVSFLRMANIGYLANRITFPSELNATIVSTDGRPIMPAEVSDTLWVLPGERYGVLIEPLVDLMDSISISYVNMNTHLSENIQYIPVNVSGTNSLVELNQDLGFKLYPNPSDGAVFIVAPEGIPYTGLKVLNSLGQVVYSELEIKQSNQSQILNLDLNQGSYSIEVLYENQTIDVLKWIKK
ncbi:MAG: multicopper oxidase domain-containing protein [Crocinitomicaceae bacterium]|tara:strand:- start:1051 stop:2280 length:1230 start_codon:yes stop_codon:yes gene_type:complete